MEPTPRRLPSLAEIEREVMAEGREWTRQRLHQLADQQREVSPPSGSAATETSRSAARWAR